MNLFFDPKRWLTLMVLLAGFYAGPSSTAATWTVDIEGYQYIPSNLAIQVGDTVTWVQKDFDAHTVTSGSNGVPDGQWNSPLLTLNQTFTRTFDTAGTFPYFCQPHPFMVATVVVEAAQVLPPEIAITSPENNAELPAGEITIAATATAPAGAIASVEFFSGETSLGSVESAPYQITVTLAAGAHVLTARATDSEGQSATSPPVTITLTTVPAGGERIEDPIEERIALSDLVIELETVAEGLVSPLGMAVPDDGSGRMFIYDQSGTVHILTQEGLMGELLLDVRDRMVSFGNFDERGLIGLAAHPNFAENPLLYTHTSEPSGPAADFQSVLPEGRTNNHQGVIAEWRIASANPNQVDLSSRREILRIDQPQGNHNGGPLRFGPDGFLYIALGDGGGADDRGPGHSEIGNGQDLNNVYGAILRIDVNARTSPNGEYGIPGNNPFVGEEGLDEIYAYGLRNPYGLSFDRLTGELYAADVGQNDIEELNRIFAGGNYGWPIKEGSFFFDPNNDDRGFVTTEPVREVPPDLIDPIAEYDQDDGSSIIGGFVYRGTAIPALLGRYVAGDWGDFSDPTGRLFFLDQSVFREFRIGLDNRELGLWVKGFGEDHEGEIYIFGSTVLGPSGATGRVLKIVPAPQAPHLASDEQEERVDLSWTGGLGPFLLESKRSLDENLWELTEATAEASLELEAAQDSSFFRVADMAGNMPLPFTVHLTGGGERPAPVATDASGSGILSVEGNSLHFNLHYTGLSGPAVGAHIHGPASASEAAGILIDLEPHHIGDFGTDGSFSGSITLAPGQKAMVLGGLTYVNIHTGNHPAGEIAGQILPVAFAAELTGAAERPTPVETPGHGNAILLLAGDRLYLNLVYTGLTGPATAAHIHGPASREEDTGVLVDLEPIHSGPFGAGGSFAGSVTLTPQQLTYLAEGLTYINIHTAAHAPGEIRGQIIPQPGSVPLSFVLSGAAERPDPVTSDGTGSGALLLEGNLLRFNITYADLSAAAVGAHIHGPATAAEAAGILVDFEEFLAEPFGIEGSFSGAATLSEQEKALLLQGLTYFNVHTPTHPPGEIRGQIAPALMSAVLLGASERPVAVHTSAEGTGRFLLVHDRLHLNATYTGLTSAAVGAHIHGPADTSQAAGIMVDLEPFNTGQFGLSGSLAGSATLTAEQLAALVDQLTYVNIHTPEHPAGEVRGQIIK